MHARMFASARARARARTHARTHLDALACKKGSDGGSEGRVLMCYGGVVGKKERVLRLRRRELRALPRGQREAVDVSSAAVAGLVVTENKRRVKLAHVPPTPSGQQQLQQHARR